MQGTEYNKQYIKRETLFCKHACVVQLLLNTKTNHIAIRSWFGGFKNGKYKKCLHNLKINGCAICGYDKCDACLEFHHVKSEDKRFYINICTIHRKDIFDELNKCILLCNRCHREIHNIVREE